MTPRFLLDANVVSEACRPRPDEQVMRRLRRHESELATAAPVWHELVFGVRRLHASKRRDDLEKFLVEVARTLPMLPYDAAAAEWHASERARLEAAGCPAPFVDGQIAAIAATRGLVVVTANTAHYEVFLGVDVVDFRR